MKRFLFSILTVALTAAATLTLGSCSDDDKYASYAPRFSDMTFTNLTGKTTFHVGDTIVATAVQKKYGHLLDRTTYKWEVSPSEGVGQKYMTGCVYDNDRSNPTDTLVFSSAGSYTIKLTARYNASGISESASSSEDFPDGGSASYASAALAVFAYVTKTIRVSN